MKGRGEGKQSTLFLSMETRTDQTRGRDWLMEGLGNLHTWRYIKKNFYRYP